MGQKKTIRWEDTTVPIQQTAKTIYWFFALQTKDEVMLCYL